MKYHRHLFAMATAMLLAGPVLAAKAHVHGAAKIDLALQAGQVTVQLEMPLDSLVGFERAPRNAAEREAAAAALARLRDGAALFRFDAAAQCRLRSAQVQAATLQPAQPGAKPEGEHADADAEYVFDCAQPAQLGSLEVMLFDAFKRLQRIQVQAVLPQGQRKATLRPAARSLKLAK